MSGDATVTRSSLLGLAEQRGREDYRAGAYSRLRDLWEMGDPLGMDHLDILQAWAVGLASESAIVAAEQIARRSGERS